MPSKAKSSPAKIIGTPFRFAEVWNHTLDNQTDRPFIARDYMYASELGGSFCDRYLKMYAVPQTNPPNTRSKRKFQAGNIWEYTIGMVLISSGMLKKQQIRVETKLPKMLKVSGRLDFIIGGVIDWKEAKANVEKTIEGLKLLGLEVPPFFFDAINKFIDKYSGVKQLKQIVLETKSCSSFMMEKMIKTGEPQPQHVMQIFHYVYGNDVGISDGKLMYVCKDDCIMQEFDIANNEELLKMYKADIKQMTAYYNAGFDKKDPKKFMPPLQPLVLFEEGVWRFNKNFKVEYSAYLQYLYGYETPEAYRMAWQYKTSSWNRVFKRCVQGANMTDKNKAAIKDAVQYFPAWDKYVAKAKAAGAFQKQEDLDDTE